MFYPPVFWRFPRFLSLYVPQCTCSMDRVGSWLLLPLPPPGLRKNAFLLVKKILEAVLSPPQRKKLLDGGLSCASRRDFRLVCVYALCVMKML